MQIDTSVIISLVALTISIFTLYLQWFRVRGAIISLLNDEEREMRTVLLPSYERLPEATKYQFPEYKEKNPSYVQIRLNFANAGDRTGISEILKIDIDSAPAWSTIDRIRASFYDHNLIPAFEMKDQIIVLRNIPPIDSETTISMSVKIAWGGASPRSGKYRQKGVIERTLKVLLIPSEVKPLASKSKKTG
jgi:hypothetical protein